jgi:hypothetical protein
VEEQQNQAGQTKAEGASAAAEKKVFDAERKRRIQTLEMQRERILSEVTSSTHRRTALETALMGIEEELAMLGWSIHM